MNTKSSQFVTILKRQILFLVLTTIMVYPIVNQLYNSFSIRQISYLDTANSGENEEENDQEEEKEENKELDENFDLYTNFNLEYLKSFSIVSIWSKSEKNIKNLSLDINLPPPELIQS